MLGKLATSHSSEARPRDGAKRLAALAGVLTGELEVHEMKKYNEPPH